MTSQSFVKKSPRFTKYLLHDYTFLHDYIILNNFYDNHQYTHHYNMNPTSTTCHKKQHQQFIAQIKGTKQLVKFKKVKFHEQYMNRFQALVQLYEKGIVLADNLFILEQGNTMYFYIIQAFIADIQINVKQSTLYKIFQSNTKQTQSFHNQPLQSQNISQLSQICPQYPRFITLSHLINSQYFSQIQLSLKLPLIDKIKILLQCVHQVGQPFVNLTPNHILIDLEDSESIYLAPYQLDIQIGGRDCLMNSYLAPQLLIRQIEQHKNMKAKQNKKRQLQVGAQAMMKADIWSFGCIMLQVLFYCTPAFYTINSKNQIKLIENFLKQYKKPTNFCIQNCQDKIKDKFKSQDKQNKGKMLVNLLKNCLQFQPKKRLLTSQRQFESYKPQSQISKTNLNSQSIFKKTLNQQQSSLQNLSIQNLSKIQPTETHDSELIIYFIHISNVHIKKQLKINIYLDRRYSIYVSNQIQTKKKGQNQHSYKIDKAITIKNKFENFYQILQTPLTVEINQNQKSAKFYLNLSTLVMQMDGKRIWNRPIIGSYKVQNNQQFKDVMIKIKSQIVTNNRNIQVVHQRDKFLQELQKNIEQKRKLLKQNTTKQQKEVVNKQNDHPRNSSINQLVEPTNFLDKINKNLQQICEKWKNKQTVKPKLSLNRIINSPKRLQQNNFYQNNQLNEMETPIGQYKKRMTKNSPIQQPQIAVQMPVSIERNIQNLEDVSTSRLSRSNKDEQIENKIKEILTKLKIK